MEHARVLVVGASAGIGRAIATAAVRRGAQVVFSARRADRLAEAVEAAGGGIALPCDSSSTEQCLALAAGVAERLGGLDLVVYSSGTSPLRRIHDVDDDDWDQVLSVNVIGAHRLLRAVLPHLAPAAVFAVLSSEVVGDPKPGLGAYAASKAALEDLVRAWRLEHPELRLTNLAVGPTMPTEFGSDFEAGLLGELLDEWIRRGMLSSTYMAVDDVGRMAVDVFSTLLAHPGISMDHLLLQPAAPPPPGT